MKESELEEIELKEFANELGKKLCNDINNLSISEIDKSACMAYIITKTLAVFLSKIQEPARDGMITQINYHALLLLKSAEDKGEICS